MEESDPSSIPTLHTDVFREIISHVAFSGSDWLHVKLTCKAWKRFADEILKSIDLVRDVNKMIERKNVIALETLLDDPRLKDLSDSFVKIFIFGCEHGSKRMVSQYLDRKAVDSWIIRNGIDVSSKSRNVEALDMIISSNHDKSFVDREGLRKPFRLAVSKGYFDIVDRLMKSAMFVLDYQLLLTTVYRTSDTKEWIEFFLERVDAKKLLLKLIKYAQSEHVPIDFTYKNETIDDWEKLNQLGYRFLTETPLDIEGILSFIRSDDFGGSDLLLEWFWRDITDKESNAFTFANIAIKYNQEELFNTIISQIDIKEEEKVKLLITMIQSKSKFIPPIWTSLESFPIQLYAIELMSLFWKQYEQDGLMRHKLSFEDVLLDKRVDYLANDMHLIKEAISFDLPIDPWLKNDEIDPNILIFIPSGRSYVELLVVHPKINFDKVMGEACERGNISVVAAILNNKRTVHDDPKSEGRYQSAVERSFTRQHTRLLKYLSCYPKTNLYSKMSIWNWICKKQMFELITETLSGGTEFDGISEMIFVTLQTASKYRKDPMMSFLSDPRFDQSLDTLIRLLKDEKPGSLLARSIKKRRPYDWERIEQLRPKEIEHHFVDMFSSVPQSTSQTIDVFSNQSTSNWTSNNDDFVFGS
eukprot:TRINITY_DN2321_c0_g1_i1.p1 TRINITY_DN2321_c0_g1~~TRINITY_DN2321_c0_g1_i1.p1  ORF type:complete len:642 (+),score=104.52 TRINITY_DN2321_c0_g1_i1:26-1951(+)